MSEFKRLCVLARIMNNSSNLCHSYKDAFRQKGNVVYCPLEISRRMVEKIAERSHLPKSKIVFVRDSQQFNPEADEWTPTTTNETGEEFPKYENTNARQFAKFLHERPGEYSKVNPHLSDVRRYCASHHDKQYLFRGTLSENNHLGMAPGLPYWVGIPHDGVVPVRTDDPDKIRRSSIWWRMGLSWMGKIEYV